MTLRAALSFVTLQIGWFSCVLGAAHGLPWIGPVVVLVGLGWHLRAQPAAARRSEVVVLAMAAGLGLVFDTAVLRLGGMTARGATLSPPWLVALWPNVAAATAPSGALARLSGRPFLAALVGALGGAAAYDGGARLGAIELAGDRRTALAGIAIAWAVVLPILLWLRRSCDPRVAERLGSR
ncbi:MAG: DUF2878 domain-containing protein [Deltaproteobacteria bacterium]|nr:DUF2878 domain-containing protein [Deltaproteobacteria bacterium]